MEKSVWSNFNFITSNLNIKDVGEYFLTPEVYFCSGDCCFRNLRSGVEAVKLPVPLDPAAKVFKFIVLLGVAIIEVAVVSKVLSVSWWGHHGSVGESSGLDWDMLHFMRKTKLHCEMRGIYFFGDRNSPRLLDMGTSWYFSWKLNNFGVLEWKEGSNIYTLSCPDCGMLKRPCFHFGIPK